VIGDGKGTAVSKLRGAGFKVHVISATQAGAAPNSVVSESPTGNSQAAKGSTVTIGVTSATQTETVPNVVGMTQSQAMSVLEGAPYNYQVNVQTEQVNGTVGTVYATTPPAKQPLAPGSSITIYVVGAPVSQSPSPPPTSSSPSPTATP